jgi:predicted NUDIX family NTP pyrophosphohydrolase
MKKNTSAGILLYRKKGSDIEIFLAHPGGPFFRNRDNGWWTIPKGLLDENEDMLEAAKREFEEEIGYKLHPESNFIELGSVKQKGGKTVYGWAVEGDIDESHTVKSNTFPLEWAPKSGKWINVPEVDKAQFFSLEEAKIKIMEAQLPFIERLIECF